MAKTPVVVDDQTEMVFPYAGIQLARPFGQSRPDTTPVANNVRFFEMLTGRGRGGARSGTDKFLPEQHSGENEIQHLTSIVTVDGEMIGFSFDGPDQMFPGIYAGIGWIDFPIFPPFYFPVISDPDTPDFEGGSGLPPEDGRKRRDQKIKVVLATTAWNVWPDGAPFLNAPSLVVTGLLTDRNGGPLFSEALAGKTVKWLTTHPSIFPVQTDPALASIGHTFTTDRPVTIFVQVKVYGHFGNVVATSNKIKLKWVKELPIIDWPDPADITVGTPLGASQLNAVAKVPTLLTVVDGEYVYDPPSGTILELGENQVLTVNFTPSNPEYFETPAEDEALIDVVEGGDIAFVQSKSDVGTGGSTGDPTIPISFDDDVVAGNLILVVIASTDASLIQTPTDDQGNTYTLVTQQLGSTGIKMYGTVASLSDSLEVTINSSGVGPYLGFAILEYTGTDLVDPVDSVDAGSGVSGTTWTTDAVDVNNAGSLVVAAFTQQFAAEADIVIAGDDDAVLREAQINQPPPAGVQSVYVLDVYPVDVATLISATAGAANSYRWVIASFKKA